MKPENNSNNAIQTKEFELKDVDVFKKFMSFMQMKVSKEKVLEDGNTLLIFSDTNENSSTFTKVGYNEFYAGILFDKNGNMIKGYIDSHVSYMSDNCSLLEKM